jgi:hypothetical protein
MVIRFILFLKRDEAIHNKGINPLSRRRGFDFSFNRKNLNVLELVSLDEKNKQKVDNNI